MKKTTPKAKKTAKKTSKSTAKKKTAAAKPARGKKRSVKAKTAAKPVKKTAKTSKSESAKKTPSKKSSTRTKSISKPAQKLPAKKKPAAKSKKTTTARTKAAKKPARKQSKPAKAAPKPAKKAAAKSKAKPAKKTAAASKPRPTKKTVTKSSTKSAGTQKAQGSTKTSPAKPARSSSSRGSSKAATAFTLDDVLGEIERSSKSRKDSSKRKTKETAEKAAAPKVIADEIKPKQQKYGAASLADILGYNPANNEKPADERAAIPKKFLRYYKLLVELRDHVNSGLTLHAEDTLKRSNRDDSGDLSGYGQHMADAGTDNFDRDFALSLVSNEQEALYEIQEAIKRIKNGTYGICETSGKPIPKERLLAVPFARNSVESQAELEKYRRFSVQRAGVFAEATGEEGKFLEDNSD